MIDVSVLSAGAQLLVIFWRFMYYVLMCMCVQSYLSSSGSSASFITSVSPYTISLPVPLIVLSKSVKAVCFFKGYLPQTDMYLHEVFPADSIGFGDGLRILSKQHTVLFTWSSAVESSDLVFLALIFPSGPSSFTDIALSLSAEPNGWQYSWTKIDQAGMLDSRWEIKHV